MEINFPRNQSYKWNFDLYKNKISLISEGGVSIQLGLSNFIDDPGNTHLPFVGGSIDIYITYRQPPNKLT